MFYGQLHDEQVQLQVIALDGKVVIGVEAYRSYINSNFSKLCFIFWNFFVIFFITFKTEFNRFLYIFHGFFNCSTLRNATRNCRTLSNNISVFSFSKKYFIIHFLSPLIIMIPQSVFSGKNFFVCQGVDSEAI